MGNFSYQKVKAMTPEDQANIKRHSDALHAMQSGVASEMRYNDKPTDPKHLRVGVNASMVDMAGLVTLLVEKGVITESEYYKAIADSMEREVARYEELLSHSYGVKIKLA